MNGERVDAGLASPVTGLPTSFRWAATASAALLSGSYLWVLARVVDVVGGSATASLFVVEVVASVALATVLAKLLAVRHAVALGLGLLAVGLLGYLATIPLEVITIHRQVTDTFALLTGLSVFRMRNAGIWALGFVPAPVFVSWYFFVRREYALGAMVGGAALSFFILTGDLDTVQALLGVVGAVGALGFGQLHRESGSIPQRNTLVVVIVAMLVLTTSVSLIPGGEARPLLPDRGNPTVEATLIDAGNELFVQGSISLSPKVRFTVTADGRDYWRIGAYDRYTGDGWVRTERSRPYTGALDPPEGGGERLTQTFTAESSVSVMPAAWKPVRVVRSPAAARVTGMDGLQPIGGFEGGEQYTVVSVRPRPSTQELQAAGTDYPGEIRTRYLQLPESLPARVGEFTTRLTQNARTPYETATLIERWLEREKSYSLDVSRPDDDIASSFLFEMDAGYCTYYATTMVVMLRTQGIPARLAVGYTPGQRVADDQWVVRGFDAHAWVEVYFPEHGWVRFDPTPAGPRSAAEQNRLQSAREAEESNVDTSLSAGASYVPVRTPTSTRDALGGNGTAGGDRFGARGTPRIPEIDLGATEPVSSTETGSSLPDLRVLIYAGILLLGTIIGIHRVGLLIRAYRVVWLRWAPGGPPRARIEGMFARLEYLLGRRYRPRRIDETPREYLDSLSVLGLDDRAVELYRLYERARYAGGATDAEARSARRLLRALL